MGGALLAMVAIAGLASLDPPNASGNSAIRECGDMAHRFAFNITTRKVPCRKARRVVRRWNKTVAGQRSGDGRVLGLYCDYRDTGYEVGDIRCTGAHGRVVRWQTAS